MHIARPMRTVRQILGDAHISEADLDAFVLPQDVHRQIVHALTALRARLPHVGVAKATSDRR